MDLRLITLFSAFVACFTLNLPALSQEAPQKHLRAGIVGLDTSHVPAFTSFFNKPKTPDDDTGIRVVAGYPGGTDMPASANRVEKFTEQLRGMGVEIVDSIPALLEKVDVVLLESVDGRIHLQEAKQILPSKKPVFIDKPLAGNLPESIAIFDLAKKYGTPIFSSSSTRFGKGLQEVIADKGKLGDILGATTWGPCSYQEGTPDLFFYAIHGIESLYTVMGEGCETVSRVKQAKHDQTTGTWPGGRLGVYRGIRSGKASFGVTVFGSNEILQVAESPDYAALCRAIAKFFHTGTPPVSEAETLELLTFMEAADESVRQGGAEVSVPETLKKAKQEAAKLAE